MIIKVKRINDDFLMEAENETGNSLLMDASKDIGGGEAAFRPMQMLLSALGGCTSIDVLLVLKKQKQKLEAYEVVLEGAREKVGEASIFKHIVLHFHLWGDLDEKKVERAVQLSLGKYCSVAKSLEPTATIDYKITLHGPS
jgi:putative redox protein